MRMIIRGGVKAGDGARPLATTLPISKWQSAKTTETLTGSTKTAAVDIAHIKSQLAAMSIVGSHFAQACSSAAIGAIGAIATDASAIGGAADSANVAATKMAKDRTTKLRRRANMTLR